MTSTIMFVNVSAHFRKNIRPKETKKNKITITLITKAMIQF